MSPQDEMMRYFTKMLNEKLSVMLYNTYRGFPITYPASVLAISDWYVAMKVHELQAVSMVLEGKTYIQSDLLPEIVRANVVSVDVLENQAVVTEFVGVGRSIGQRAYTRVHPDEPIDAEIYDGSRRIGGKLADISSKGVGVFTFAAYIYGDLAFEDGKDVLIDFRLPNMEKIVRFRGVVTSVVHPEGTFLQRLGLRIYPDPEIEALLQEYISVRQEETRREMQLIYESMCRERLEKG
ncbi:MAG: PilZ domain-containing protein [Anaerolineales bacterium]|nr:PilZ domain-containing protein [Anaerolineales bacterium]